MKLSKYLSVIGLLAFALLSQTASACYYPDGKCASAAAEAPAEAAPAAESEPAAEAPAEAEAE